MRSKSSTMQNRANHPLLPLTNYSTNTIFILLQTNQHLYGLRAYVDTHLYRLFINRQRIPHPVDDAMMLWQWRYVHSFICSVLTNVFSDAFGQSTGTAQLQFGKLWRKAQLNDPHRFLPKKTN